MRAAVYHNKEESPAITVEDVPKPEPKKDEVLVKVKYCGICGSDLEAYKDRTYPFDIVIGHEMMGFVELLGPETKGVKIGQRVTVDPNVPCGKCTACQNGKENICNKINVVGVTRNGGFAEYVSVPIQTLNPLPDEIPNNHGTIFDQVGTAMHSLNICDFRFGETAVIIGMGTIGLLVLQSLKYAGVSKVICIDKNPHRLEICKSFEPNLALDQISTKKILRITKKGGADHVFNCTSAPIIDDAFDLARKGGKIIQVGLRNKPIETNFMKIMMNEYCIFGSYGYTPWDFKNAISLVAEKKIDPTLIITKNITLDKIIEEGFEEALDPETKNIKILVEFN